MKKYLLVALLIAGGSVATAEAQTRTFRAPAGQRGEQVQQRRAPEPTRRREVGAFVRGARGGNPAYLINPAAPRKYYGPPHETVTWNPDFRRDPYSGSQITGLILFGIHW
ncbi:MAG TPA: hypothetical protein VG095_09890 [Chthoniobacterales bacterium]|nr:hypothetical protein [Chthoniobacterales bacterium]